MYKTDAKENLSYEYEMVENCVTLYVGDRLAVIPGFGIKITVIDSHGTEYSQVYEKISPYREKVEQLIARFANLALSPYHLWEVMDDIIEEYIVDFDLCASESIDTFLYKNVEVAI
ncbi:hypothetical protein SAMN02746089_02529 [Caldanaerobius fijiensis DSM 17918]|uniref:Uncharacterized protein n=1 Tax=Caldanaerobius fijiensis DSM 17918 TaxID=1121256 RepID=A0A1M5EE75_9THEO|nr:DUF6514 family protein [Caldanaerobius fijiensis]SHF77496.1 hypothetical protein SAMN02746089_02529 [Caldanaerobius fijiensis DSM 17918]